VVFVRNNSYPGKPMKTLKYLSIAAMILAFGACQKIEKLSPRPRIEFTSFAVFDTIDLLENRVKGGRLKFYFEDGDGNLGLIAPDYPGSDTNNLFLTLYRKIDGIMVPATINDPLYPSSYRIPLLRQDGQDKVLKGTIAVTFMYLFYSQGDTIRYDFTIKDRADNMSNQASTSEIVLSVNGVY
jgi:hypothetical protein